MGSAAARMTTMDDNDEDTKPRAAGVVLGSIETPTLTKPRASGGET